MTQKGTQPGEGDEELGIPLSVVCIESEKIEKLEREQDWQEDHFDFLLQWIRTVLLKHAASLCYVASFDSNDVKTLLHTSMGIQSLLRKDVAKWQNSPGMDGTLGPMTPNEGTGERKISENIDKIPPLEGTTGAMAGGNEGSDVRERKQAPTS